MMAISVLRAAGQQLATLEAGKALADRLQNVERQVGRKIRSGADRPWQLPTRQPAAGAAISWCWRWKLRAGLTSRKAKAVVNAFWNMIPAALRRGETVETLLGVFRIARGPKPASAAAVG